MTRVALSGGGWGVVLIGIPVSTESCVRKRLPARARRGAGGLAKAIRNVPVDSQFAR